MSFLPQPQLVYKLFVGGKTHEISWILNLLLSLLAINGRICQLSLEPLPIFTFRLGLQGTKSSHCWFLRSITSCVQNSLVPDGYFSLTNFFPDIFLFPWNVIAHKGLFRSEIFLSWESLLNLEVASKSQFIQELDLLFSVTWLGMLLFSPFFFARVPFIQRRIKAGVHL